MYRIVFALAVMLALASGTSVAEAASAPLSVADTSLVHYIGYHRPPPYRHHRHHHHHHHRRWFPPPRHR